MTGDEIFISEYILMSKEVQSVLLYRDCTLN